jgi:dTDP-4-amino-4,6-dideoxygalactose transaminase
MIPFTKPTVLGIELDRIADVISNRNQCGDGYYSKKCEKLLEELTFTKKALLTPSCTAALEMAAILIDIQPGDEVILPSYTFVSTANAFALRGAVPVFVDIEPLTMNIDPGCIEDAITPKTKAIVPVHYAGVACDMDSIMSIAEKYNLYVVEDAAQAIGSLYKGHPLGSIGHFGAFSFHGTKNITSGGEGGALLINDGGFIESAEILREKGTNRKQFLKGAVDKYSWVGIGSSFLPSELQAAYLYEQLLNLEKVNSKRVALCNQYDDKLSTLYEVGCLGKSFLPSYATNNGHMYFIKCNDEEERSKLIHWLREVKITCVFHYVPLHSSVKGREISRFNGEDNYTTSESEKLLRLPLYYALTNAEVEIICDKINEFYFSRDK